MKMLSGSAVWRLFLSLVLGMAILPSAGWAADIAQWTFETSVPTAGPFSPEVGSGSATGFHAGTATYSNPAGNGSAKSFSSNTWAVGDYYQFQVSTTGYTGIQISWAQTSSNTGPRDFMLRYSTDGTNFTDIGTQYSVLANATPNTWDSTTPVAAANFTHDLSGITALNNQSTVYFSLVANSTTSANGGTVASGGTNRVDNFTVTGISTVGFTLIKTTASVNESGTTDTFTVVLDGQPASNVEISVTSDNTNEAAVSPATLTFTSADWDTAQTVTVTGVDDSEVDGDQTTTVTLSVVDVGSDDAFDAVTNKTVTVTTVDNDMPGISGAQIGGSINVSESGTTGSYTIALNTQPTGDVEITVTADAQTQVSSDGTTFGNTAVLTFTNGNWNTAQTVTVKAIDDTVIEGNHTGTITHAITGTVIDTNYPLNLALGSVTVNITDNDSKAPTSYVSPPPPPETKVIVSFGGDGKGKVTSNPSGIDCQSPTACSYTFETKETIQLTPQAVGNSRFQNWGNACNDGMISASGRTVYCTVYFVDMTPPPVVKVEPEPVVTPEPEPVVEPEPTPESVVEPEPVAEPEPVVEPEPELPPTDDTSEPVAEPVIEEPPVVEEPVDVIPEPEPDVIPEPTETLPPSVNDETCPPKDSLSYYCNAGGQTIGDLNIVENPQATNGVGFLSNAVIIGVVQLNPDTWIANLHVKSTGKVIGGVVTGLIYNEGYLGDFVFKGEFIKGGKLGGKILNLSKIFSWFEDVTFTANAHLIGGALKGKIKGDPKKPALLENLRILSGSSVSGVIIGNGVKIDENVVIEDSTADVEPVDDTQLPALDEQFSAGIGVNDSSYQTRNVAQILSDNVSIRGKMHVNQKHVGKKVKVFVTVSYRVNEDSDEEFIFTINHLSGLMPWDGKKSSLGENPFKTEETLQTTQLVKIYDGILLATGVVNIRFGYISEDGTVVQSSEGIELVTLN